MKLDIGGGAAPLPNYTVVDPFFQGENIITAPMWDIPLADASVDEIYSSHALEHIPQRMVVPTLQEWKRILKPEGHITIRVPDLVWCCNRWLQTQGTGWDMAILFGHQANEGEFHKTGFTPLIMWQYAMEAGLRIVRHETIWTHEQQTLSFEVRK